MNKNQQLKFTTFNIFSLIAVIGMIAWFVSDYFGGMIIHLIMYWFLIIPILALYLINLIRTITKTLKHGIKVNKVSLIIHSVFFLFLFADFTYNSELFKSKTILKGTLKDDLSHQTLILRKDGTCENNIIGFLGFKEQFKGTYIMKGDTIIFTKKPYDNDFLPDTILYNKKEKAIFISKNNEGNFSTEKVWLNHFDVE